MRSISRIGVHHSASEFGDVATFRTWHLARGWRDVGYHAVVLNGRRTAGAPVNDAEIGLVESGRPEAQTGAHTLNCNSDSLGLCLVGNFEAGPAPDPRQWQAAVRHIAGWCRTYSVPVARVLGHREFPGQGTACPGRNFNLDQFRADVATVLGQAAPAAGVRILRRGCRGEDVAELQRFLGIKADSVFGDDTYAAVVAYQLAHGLEPDGVVGTLTRAMMQAAGAGQVVQPVRVRYPSGLECDVAPEGASEFAPAHASQAAPLVALTDELRATRVSPHFTLGEFASKDGATHVRLAPALVELLEALRARWGRPMTVNSGYRSPAHNRAVGGEARSFHIDGLAADIAVSGVAPSIVYAAANVANPYGGVGKYTSFTHVDVRDGWSRW